MMLYYFPPFLYQLFNFFFHNEFLCSLSTVVITAVPNSCNKNLRPIIGQLLLAQQGSLDIAVRHAILFRDYADFDCPKIVNCLNETHTILSLSLYLRWCHFLTSLCRNMLTVVWQTNSSKVLCESAFDDAVTKWKAQQRNLIISSLHLQVVRFHTIKLLFYDIIPVWAQLSFHNYTSKLLRVSFIAFDIFCLIEVILPYTSVTTLLASTNYVANNRIALRVGQQFYKMQ